MQVWNYTGSWMKKKIAIKDIIKAVELWNMKIHDFTYVSLWLCMKKFLFLENTSYCI